ADAEFKATYNHLYDKDDKLFFRDSRYFGQQEANGKKVFWGRGNGWVIGGLA
ncbi:MAG TPA: family 88 glycosyl hydrolase, partial [Parabacteroides goldsteinii]|nr:family 88 glycosyl hydrolase [Parabacteroides goldsteinii]